MSEEHTSFEPPLVRQVRIINYKCLRDVTVDFAPMTILVGPNASGKSAILEALNPGRSFESREFWRGSTEGQAGTAYDLADGSRTARTARGAIGPFAGRKGADFFFQLVKFDVDRLRRSSKLNRSRKVTASGEGIVNVFSTLSRREQEGFAKTFARIVPVYSDVDTVPYSNGHLQLRFYDRWDRTLTYAPEQVSDGTMMAFAYLLLQYQLDRPELLCIEEPERGLHPYLLQQVVELLRGMAEGRIGPKPMQVVIATHSAMLLEYARPEEVRFVDRDPQDGATFVTAPPVDEEGWQETFEVYRRSLGDVWLSGAMGGVPGRIAG